MAKSISKASEYEQMFQTRHRGAGRPGEGEVGASGDVMFPSRDRHPAIVRVAARRAYAVVHEENRERLSEIFEKECKVLARRGPEIVAEDAGLVILADGRVVSERTANRAYRVALGAL